MLTTGFLNYNVTYLLVGLPGLMKDNRSSNAGQTTEAQAQKMFVEAKLLSQPPAQRVQRKLLKIGVQLAQPTRDTRWHNLPTTAVETVSSITPFTTLGIVKSDQIIIVTFCFDSLAIKFILKRKTALCILS